MEYTKYAILRNRKIIIIGFGSIGPTALLLILRHIDISPHKIEIISDSNTNYLLAKKYDVKFQLFKLTPENYKSYLSSRLNVNDILINLSVGISSLNLIELCQQQGALYLDTSNETWPSEATGVRTTTYERREKMKKEKPRFSPGPTALICHGANPGLVTHFAKKAVLDVATSIKNSIVIPNSPEEWARLAEDIGVISLHISERDTQVSAIKRLDNEYVNTWSIDGLLEESAENVGFAWGTHEIELPAEVVKTRINGEKCQVIELCQLGAETQINSWIPSKGIFSGYLIPHPEAYSIAELFSRRESNHMYHPTVHFVYRPCQDAVDSMHHAMEQGWVDIKHKRLLRDDILEGKDELGILVLRNDTSDIYWFGSRLDIKEARNLVPQNNATSIQVAAGVLSGLVWLIENPNSGLVEPEQVDFQRALNVATPYLGELIGYWAKWPEEAIQKITSRSLKLQFDNLLEAVV